MHAPRADLDFDDAPIIEQHIGVDALISIWLRLRDEVLPGKRDGKGVELTDASSCKVGFERSLTLKRPGSSLHKRMICRWEAWQSRTSISSAVTVRPKRFCSISTAVGLGVSTTRNPMISRTVSMLFSPGVLRKSFRKVDGTVLIRDVTSTDCSSPVSDGASKSCASNASRR